MIEVIEVKQQLPKPVKKQIWNGEKFVAITVYRLVGITDRKNKLDWLQSNYGASGTYHAGKFWDYSRPGNFLLMEEQVYMWYQLKWGEE